MNQILEDQLLRAKKQLLEHRTRDGWCSSKIHFLAIHLATEIADDNERQYFSKEITKYIEKQLFRH